jgi:hypothetical protein
MADATQPLRQEWPWVQTEPEKPEKRTIYFAIRENTSKTEKTPPCVWWAGEKQFAEARRTVPEIWYCGSYQVVDRVDVTHPVHGTQTNTIQIRVTGKPTNVPKNYTRQF